MMSAYGPLGERKSWHTAEYHVLAEPGEREARPLGDPISTRRFYALPGTALLKHWPDRGSAPEYFEIGTVNEDGTIRWDCLTYANPSPEVLNKYVSEGFCPPEFLDEFTVRLTPHEESMVRSQHASASHYINDSNVSDEWKAWGNAQLDARLADHTLTFRERDEILSAIVRATYDGDRNNADLNTSTAQIEELRDSLIGRRTQIVRDDIESRRRPTYVGTANPSRHNISTSPQGLPYQGSRNLEFTSEPFGDLSAWPKASEPDPELVETAANYQESHERGHERNKARDHMKLFDRDSAQQEPRYRERRGRGRLS